MRSARYDRVRRVQRIQDARHDAQRNVRGDAADRRPLVLHQRESERPVKHDGEKSVVSTFSSEYDPAADLAELRRRAAVVVSEWHEDDLSADAISHMAELLPDYLGKDK
jgi:hypothetical protein